jgi:hypothetical protein
MCTLTYRLTELGYQLFFNRDEQITRPQAIKPTKNITLKAVYPIDPTGGGTWIAAHETGTSLALLNYYQAQVDSRLKNFTSRGVIIPHLLNNINDIHTQLLAMELSTYQAFQLCVFDAHLSDKANQNERAIQYIWDGVELTHSTLSIQTSLPITSSGVDFPEVYAYRKRQYIQMIDNGTAEQSHYIDYHQHQGESGKCSVKMHREDAKTVSFTQINVNQNEPLGRKVMVQYVDYLAAPPNTTSVMSL